MTEEWKVIQGWEAYQVSNYGRVRAIKERRIAYKDGTTRTYPPKYINGSKTSQGYIHVTLVQQGKKERLLVHRLVAEAFIPNKENKPCVNHIDNNPSNNRFENLEWCTLKENTAWMIKQGRADRTETWLKRLRNTKAIVRKAVKATNIATGEIKVYEYLNGVAKDGFQTSCVSDCCNGKRHTHKGYLWEFCQ